MSRIRSRGGVLALAILAAGCGGSGPETPPEQKTPETGLSAMEKMKSMQGDMKPEKGGPQSAMEKMKSMGGK